MNIKKFLEKAAEEDREALINDRDIEFLASIGVDYNKKREAANKEPDSSYYLTARTINYKALYTSIACFLIVAITVISLSLYFTLKPSPVESIHYFEDNFVEVDSNLDELNKDLRLFSLNVDENDYRVAIKRTYDSLSGDDLFFTLDFTALSGTGKNFELDVVVNKSFTHEKLPYSNKEQLLKAQFLDYTLEYEEITQPMSGRLVTVDCIGEIQIGEQWIYITKYNEMAMGQGTFVETLSSIIKIK